jgi:hypothetical protein
MAVDLAERGTSMHAFPLAALARDLELPTWPTAHIGYYPPGPDNRAPTMWSIGWPLCMVPLYWLGGLEALYWAAPLMGALALLATALMAGETLREQPHTVRWAAAALCCALVATSPEGSERLLVPMADAAAQFFAVLTLWLLLRARRGHPALHGALAGLSFGAAYWVRHPLLPLGAAAVAAAVWAEYPFYPRARRSLFGSRRFTESQADRRLCRGSGLVLLGAFGLTALVVALPDLFFHKMAYGGWLTSESSEWFLLSVGNTGRTAFAILQQGLLRRQEIGFLAPFFLLGAWLLWRHHRYAALLLGVGFGAVYAFHLLYEALRPRDLIAILPVLYLCVAYGLVEIWRHLWGSRCSEASGGDAARRTLGAAILLFGTLLLVFARSYHVLSLPWREDVTTFGHVRADQAQEFARLAQLVPEDAVVGSALNSGAIELHAGRAAVHPAPWSESELSRWIDALRAEGRAFYLLDDGEEMRPLLERLEGRYQLRSVAILGLPYFSVGGGSLPWPARLYEVLPP